MGGKLDDKVALVTDGSSGIGFATAKQFVKEGAFVYVTGRRQAELDVAAKFLGNHAKAVHAEVSNLADLDALYAQIGREQGRLDVLIADAGEALYAPLGQITEQSFDHIFNTTVKSVLFTVQKALPLIPNGGAIVLKASTISIKPVPAFGIYSAVKAAVRSFVRGWTKDLKDRKIRVNAVSPDLTNTEGLKDLAETCDKRYRFENPAAIFPLGRLGLPEEIAKAVVFLASNDASYITGVELFVGSGRIWI
ncbi:SDR family oxidoreductase [Granulicella sp. dw_53]|uniref:SDR family NAD(P)-dependent oxidoreductase n=1 Tax=Granulicella sp. dw_53 TaxID=2719792 RepID=UPI001BD36C26|nr:SDR family oxidoreductase [Granulicella sp. dw_53]